MSGPGASKRARQELIVEHPERHGDCPSSGHHGSCEDVQDVQDGHEFGDCAVECQSSGPVARKRELERQRRNLVNARFVELDQALANSATPCAPKTLHQARRIDREAILKDATARLGSLSLELNSVKGRLSSMEEEVQSLRAEKIELRADKAYLHSELTALRAETQRLRNDNIHLWQAIRNSAGLKTVLSADVAKIPVEILLRAQMAHRSHQTPGVMLQQRSNEEASVLPPREPCNLSDARSLQLGRSQVMNSDGNNLSDAFLVFQSPEELGELITGYGDAGIPEAQHAQILTQGTDMKNQGSSDLRSAFNENNNTSQQLLGLDMQNTPMVSTATLPASGSLPSSAPMISPGGHDPDSSSMHHHARQQHTGEYTSEDFLADIAYCA